MKIPYIPITKLECQVDTVLAFCESWQTPISISYEEKEMVVMTWHYYLENFCTEEDQARLEKEIEVATDR